jgi:hypothetical protein
MYVRQKYKRNNREDLKGDLWVDRRINLKRILQKYSTGEQTARAWRREKCSGRLL